MFTSAKMSCGDGSDTGCLVTSFKPYGSEVVAHDSSMQTLKVRVFYLWLFKIGISG